MNHKDMVIKVANQIGYYFKPKRYISEVASLFGVRVSPSTVVKAIGSYSSRRFRNDKHASRLGKEFLDCCCGDLYAAKQILDQLAVP